MALCGRGFALYREEPVILAVLLRCKRADCPTCGWRRLKQWRDLAIAGRPTTFLTLTSNPAWGECPRERLDHLQRAWELLRKRIERLKGLKSLPYMRVIEATRRGEPHMHVLMRAPFIEQAWISEQMRELNSAPIVDVRAVRSNSEVARYVSKYVTKGGATFEGRRRFAKSRDWIVDDPPSRDPLPRRQLAWIARDFSLETFRKHCVLDGWTVEDQAGGAFTIRHANAARAPPFVAYFREVCPNTTGIGSAEAQGLLEPISGSHNQAAQLAEMAAGALSST